MRSKRKASPVYSKQSPNKGREAQKNNKIIISDDEEDGNESSDEQDNLEEEWEINGILEETESQYLVDWAGGYSPTWEPKDNASDLAIQVWEERKNKSQLAPETTGDSDEPPTQTSPNIQERALTPTPEQRLSEVSNFSLFVSPDAAAGDNSRESNPLSISSLVVEESIQVHTNTKVSTRKHSQNVFEYYPWSPIPSEYLIAGESEEHNRSTTSGGRTSNSTEGTSARPRETWTRSSPIVQPSPRTEIPETPSILSLASPSQQIGSRVTGSQKSLGILLNTLPPHIPQPTRLSPIPGPHTSIQAVVNSTVGTPLAHYTASVIEPAPQETLRSSILHQPIDPAGQRTCNTANPRPSILPPLAFCADTSSPLRTILLNTPSTPPPATSCGSPALSTRIANIQSPTARFRSRTAAMESDREKKEGSSLAETMEKYSHMEGLTPREKVRNLYAKLREGTTEALQNDPSATPSSVGDIEPSEPPSVPETVAPLSIRVDKDPHAVPAEEPGPEPSVEGIQRQSHDIEGFQTVQPSALTIDYTEQQSPGSVHLGPSEFAVPLPMDSRVKDDYERALLDNCQDIWRRASDDKPQEALDFEQEQAVISLQQVLERLSNAATHPDINIAQHVKSADSNLEQEAAWAEYSSAKFLLLSYLIKAPGDHDIHLVISVRGEKTQGVVERYLKGKGFSYTRPREEMGSGTSVEVSMARAALSFGIQTAQGDGIVETYKPPLAIIALDSSLNTKSPSVEHLRTTFARNGDLLPVVRLVVANSSEHVELSFPGPPTRDHFAMILRHSTRLRDIVGDLQDDALGVQEDAGEIMTSLLSGNFNASWSLPPVEPLRQSSLDDSDDGEDSTKSTSEPSRAAATVSQKRLFVEEALEPAPKRPRMDESQETSQFTVSSKGAPQTLDSDLQTLEKNLVQMRGTYEASLERLQKLLVATQTLLQGREKALGALQHRYESRTKELHTIRRERDRLLEAKTTSDQKLEKQKEDISKLKDERTQLRHDLETTREALKSGGGDAAELEKAREEVRRLEKENASLERKSEYEHKQAEYTRDQYQTASNVAAQSATELRQLKEEHETLTRKLAGEAAKLRELNMESDQSKHLTRVAELESLLSSREDLLQRKEDELREIRKNRPSTRSTSTAPRSPKLNAGNSRPTSPGINNNNGHNFPGRGSALRFSSEMSF
ncbi:class II histone deacetylase complex subunits 2 and 3-domain-containing protein [Aspergillus crustosus]